MTESFIQVHKTLGVASKVNQAVSMTDDGDKLQNVDDSTETIQKQKEPR